MFIAHIYMGVLCGGREPSTNDPDRIAIRPKAAQRTSSYGSMDAVIASKDTLQQAL